MSFYFSDVPPPRHERKASCDNCGRPFPWDDEYLCPACKPRTTSSSATRFACYAPDGSLLAQGPIRGAGGMLGFAAAHRPAPERDKDALETLLAVQRVYERKGHQSRLYEPQPGHVAVYPDFSAISDGEPVAVPLKGTRFALAPLSHADAQDAWLQARDEGRLTPVTAGLTGYSMDGHLVRVAREDGGLKGVWHCDDLRNPGETLIFGACASLLAYPNPEDR